MYMRYTQGQNKEYLLSRSMYLLSGLVYVHEVYTGTEQGVLTIQEYVLNQVLAKQVPLYVPMNTHVYKGKKAHVRRNG